MRGSVSCLVCGKALQLAELGVSVEVQVHDGAGRPLRVEACPGDCSKRLLEHVVRIERTFIRRRRDPVTMAAAELARELRHPRRTRAGIRPKSWEQIADELVLAGHPPYHPDDLRDAVPLVPLQSDAEAAERERVTESFRAAWEEEFPGEEWPGLEAATRRLRLKNVRRPTEAA
jgi:hypothetical protein